MTPYKLTHSVLMYTHIHLHSEANLRQHEIIYIYIFYMMSHSSNVGNTVPSTSLSPCQQSLFTTLIDLLVNP